MSSKIDSSVGPAAAAAALRPVSRSREQVGSPAQLAGKPGESLELTGEARLMQQLEQRVQSETGIDENKVAEMRRVLASGQYSANPEAIAGRLMQFEWALGETP